MPTLDFAPPASRTQVDAHVDATATPGKATLVDAMVGGGAHVAAHAPAQVAAADPRLSGTMLVSNNPEGLSTAGVIMSAELPAGPLAVYIHHSNHSHAPMHMFVVITPLAGSLQMTMSGVSASEHGARALAGGGSAQWKHDPNALVAVANEARGGPDKALVHSHAYRVDTARAIPIGVIAGLHAGQLAENATLFDARYHVTLSKPARIAIVAETPTAVKSAATDRHAATGNTKYQEPDTNGRAAGVYTGSRFTDREAAAVSALEKQPRRLQLTGGAKARVSPKATQQMQVQAPSATTLAEVRHALATSVDHAAVIVLDQCFRIAPAWLRETHLWDGTHLAMPTKPTMRDYKALFLAVLGAVAADARDPDMAHTRAVVHAHRVVGASADAASYGTQFDLGVAIHNDTPHAAAIDATFITDTEAASAGGKSAVWMGALAIDGVDHAVEKDSRAGLSPRAPLGTVAEIAPHASHELRVAFESPGQATAGQELDLAARPK